MRKLSLLALTMMLPAGAVEFAVLHTGARVQAKRIEKAEHLFVLHTESGRIEIDAALVASLEHEDDPVVATPAQSLEQKRQLSPRELVTEAALRHGLPPEIVHALASTESAYRANAVSPKGAMGVMQLMPGTAQKLNADPQDVEQNIDAGTRLLRELLLKYENDPSPVRRALAAYNAGEGAVSRYNGVPPYRETQAYVEKVIERYWKQVGKRPTSTPAAAGPSAPRSDSSRPAL